jgi:hypothetical protein
MKICLAELLAQCTSEGAFSATDALQAVAKGAPCNTCCDVCVVAPLPTNKEVQAKFPKVVVKSKTKPCIVVQPPQKKRHAILSSLLAHWDDAAVADDTSKASIASDSVADQSDTPDYSDAKTSLPERYPQARFRTEMAARRRAHLRVRLLSKEDLSTPTDSPSSALVASSPPLIPCHSQSDMELQPSAPKHSPTPSKADMLQVLTPPQKTRSRRNC